MKDFLKRMIASKEAKVKELRALIDKSEDINEVRTLGETLQAVLDELNDAKNQLDEIEKEEPAPQPINDDEERGLNPLATMGMNPTKKANRNADPYDTVEYRTAFMDFVCRGVTIPTELRADATTTTSDASAVIPTTILNEMVTELKTYGTLYSRVRKLNVQGGVNIPILSLKPTATWITANTSTSESDKQKIQANTSVSFNYYGLECKVSQTLLASVTTLDMFQQMFVPLAVEAIAKAWDIAIINGTGGENNQPVGIATDSRVASSHKVTLSPTDFASWAQWKKQVFAKIPAAYRNGTFIMAQGTFDGYIDGMIDSNGQPIGRVNYGIDGAETYRFGGKEVLIVENDVIKDWDSATGHATTGDIVAVFVNLNDYAINSNLELQTVKWVDNDTNEVLNKVIMIADGKLVDPNGVVIIKKGVDTTSKA